MKTVATLLHRTALFAAAALLFTGCAGTTGQKNGPGFNGVEAGQPVSRVTADTLRPGEVTGTQVRAELGPPTLQLDGARVMAYVWQTTSSSWNWWNTQTHHGHRVRAFALVFDADQRLQRHTWFSATSSDELRQLILQWANPAPPVAGRAHNASSSPIASR